MRNLTPVQEKITCTKEKYQSQMRDKINLFCGEKQWNGKGFGTKAKYDSPPVFTPHNDDTSRGRCSKILAIIE